MGQHRAAKGCATSEQAQGVQARPRGASRRRAVQVVLEVEWYPPELHPEASKSWPAHFVSAQATQTQKPWWRRWWAITLGPLSGLLLISVVVALVGTEDEEDPVDPESEGTVVATVGMLDQSESVQTSAVTMDAAIDSWRD